MDLTHFRQLPWLGNYMDGADHIDVKTGSGSLTLREFVAGVLSYQPAWMRWLWSVRVKLLKALGQGKTDIPEPMRFTAETLPVNPGERAEFFQVQESDGETFWIAVGEEQHLGAAIAVMAVPQSDKPGRKEFQLMTVVRYRNWAGPIYFNIIRLFHHLVVTASMKAVLKPSR